MLAVVKAMAPLHIKGLLWNMHITGKQQKPVAAVLVANW